jgi:hypothetical protein
MAIAGAALAPRLRRPFPFGARSLVAFWERGSGGTAGAGNLRQPGGRHELMVRPLGRGP